MMDLAPEQQLPPAHKELLNVILEQGHPTYELQQQVIAEVREEEEDVVPAEDVVEPVVLQPQKRKSSHL
jgi:hypothetical protein